MKMRSKILLGCLILGSSVGAAQAFPGAGRHAGEVFYHTGNRVPDQYMVQSNIIHNYHHYHLEKPADAYIFVHGEENDYLLVSAKSHILRRVDNRPNIPRASDG
jgi:hypothetical protein